MESRLCDAIFDEAPQGPHAILPLNFLSFFVGAPPIANTHFVNAQLPLGDLYRNLWLKTETRFPQRNRLNNFAPENFVAGFHVAQIYIGKSVGQNCKNPVADGVPEVK